MNDKEAEMADITVKRFDELEDPYGGRFLLARKSLGVSAWGMNVERYPAGYDDYPEHDHAGDGQEEVYVPLSGSAVLIADGEEHVLEPGMLARVGPGQKRKIVTRAQPIELLCLGGTPGAAYTPGS